MALPNARSSGLLVFVEPADGGEAKIFEGVLGVHPVLDGPPIDPDVVLSKLKLVTVG